MSADISASGLIKQPGPYTATPLPPALRNGLLKSTFVVPLPSAHRLGREGTESQLIHLY